jgi:hypothetical protein
MKTEEELKQELVIAQDKLMLVKFPQITLEDIMGRTVIYHKRCQVNHLASCLLNEISFLEYQIRMLQFQ